MLRFIIRRLIQMVGVVIVLSFLLFVWLRSLPGGTVSAILGERATPETRAALSKALGLDQPIWVQYGSYAKRILSGDFGVSTGVLPGTDALDIFLTRFPATLELSILAIVIAVSAAIPLGYLAARRRATWFDNLSILGSLVGVAVPVFFLAFLLKYYFAIENNWLPVSGRQSSGIDATRVTGFLRARRGHHAGVGRRVGCPQAPHPAGHRPGHHPLRRHLPDHPGLGARRDGGGLRAHGSAARA